MIAKRKATVEMAPSEPRKFFKVILSSTIQQGKMKIPKPFVKEQGGKLSETVRLSIPTGQSWSVRIERESETTVWFLDGFDKFLEHSSIGIEYILVFSYYGNSEFGVQIFDSTASEIEYACIDDLIHSDDSSVECLGSLRNDPFPITPARRGLSDGTNNVERCYLKRQKKQVMVGGVEDNVKANHNGKKSTMYKDTKRNNGIGTSLSPGDIERDRTIEPEIESSPNVFKVTMRPVFIEKYLLVVPSDFALLHMSRSTRLIKLVDAENNEWAVRYIRQHYTSILSSGWMHFVRDKKLTVGDVCIFERVFGGDEVKLRVTISRYGNNLD